LFLFSILNSRISKNMCICRHKLCNSKTGVGPTFTWSNEHWYMQSTENLFSYIWEIKDNLCSSIWHIEDNLYSNIWQMSMDAFTVEFCLWRLVVCVDYQSTKIMISP
jgi:hypothetical protein